MKDDQGYQIAVWSSVKVSVREKAHNLSNINPRLILDANKNKPQLKVHFKWANPFHCEEKDANEILLKSYEVEDNVFLTH